MNNCVKSKSKLIIDNNYFDTFRKSLRNLGIHSLQVLCRPNLCQAVYRVYAKYLPHSAKTHGYTSGRGFYMKLTLGYSKIFIQLLILDDLKINSISVLSEYLIPIDLKID